MYCVKCGVLLEDTEKKCPLCSTAVYHPDIKREEATPLFPENKYPKQKPRSRKINGLILILFFIPVLLSLSTDFQNNGRLDWFGFVAGGLIVGYVILALPLWFRNPSPVIFTPCSFAAIILYLLYINFKTGGNWFLSFAFPITGGLCLITCAVITLLRYLQKGSLYVWGGALIALGALTNLAEFLLNITFGFSFMWWSVYPLIVFSLIGGGLIYLAINDDAREVMERKLFF